MLKFYKFLFFKLNYLKLNLEYFSISCFNLTDIEVTKLFAQNESLITNFAPILTNLTIKNSKIYDLSLLNYLLKFPKLLILDLSFNQIQSLISPTDTFFSSIIFLYLNGNKLPVNFFY